MRSCAIHVHKHSVEAMLLQQCREVTTVILSITPWLPAYMGQSLIRCNIDTNLMSCTLEISTPFLEGSRHCKQLLVVYLIIDLMLIHFARIKSDGVQTAFILLRKDSANCEI